MITSNTNGTCIYSGSTAIIGSTSTVSDNVTNTEACGGALQGSVSPGPAPKI